MIAFTVPVRTYNNSNGSHGHWTKDWSVATEQKNATRIAFLAATNGTRWKLDPPYRVLLRRVASRLMDSDAFPQSMKHIRDQIADELGVTDGPTDTRAVWLYEQKRGKRGSFSVEVEIACG